MQLTIFFIGDLLFQVSLWLSWLLQLTQLLTLSGRPPHNHRSFVLRNLQTLDSTSIYSPHCMTPEHWRGKERSFHIFMENRSSSQFTITSLITMNKFSHFILCLPSCACARSYPIHSGIFRSSWVIRFYPIFAIALVRLLCCFSTFSITLILCCFFSSFA